MTEHHARITTTKDVYTYLLSSSDEHAANVLDNMIQHSNEEINNMPTSVQIDNTQKILDEMNELGITNIVDYMNHPKNNVC